MYLKNTIGVTISGITRQREEWPIHFPEEPEIMWPGIERPISMRDIRRAKSNCPNDDGERTNTKLKDQPFYHRQRNGKMRKH